MNACQLSRLEANKSALLGVIGNLMQLSAESESAKEALVWAAAQVRRACERLDEVGK